MKIPIIPEKQSFGKTKKERGINLRAICIFSAIGFFLEKDTYYKDLEALQPATEYEIDDDNFIKGSNHYWQWNYSPKDISLDQATQEFAHLFEKISSQELKDKKIILPLSGGLDSRTQAAALENNSEVQSYSYKFADSFDENKYGKEISRVKSFHFSEFVIQHGYLWKVIEALAGLNQCYADFTHPRQMAVIDEIRQLGDIFYLGHWGDVLFDSTGVEDYISFEQQVQILIKKILKKGGLELANELWKFWGLDGDFKSYLTERVSVLLRNIKIENANSRIRAFKSIYWAPRWTSANMVVFGAYKPLALPYYHDDMCKFICKIPEHLLAGRQIQINYIKMKNPELAKIPWQNYDPLNLYNYKKFKNKSLIPLRVMKKGHRVLKEKLSGKKLTTRNWEIQFTGENNDMNLKKYLFENKSFSQFISPDIVKIFYNKFKNEDQVYFSHSVSSLLTLSLFCKLNSGVTD